MVYKAVKMELKILTEQAQDNEDVIDSVKQAMEIFCEFYGSECKILEIHEGLIGINTSDDKIEA